MQHFYDGQIRRYLTQLVRLFSNFSYKDGDNKIVRVPVMYGDITRQVGHILRDNSENKVPSAPRMAVYITGLEQDRSRTSDSSYTNKVHIRERAYDDTGNEYLNTQGKNYTVERIMPSPYTLNVNVDIWSTNTDQKLQIMEQLLMLFNPSLEIQTTDNYVDWSSLTSVELTSMSFSSRSIPIGTESEIDVAQLSFTTPIYINMPAKVKKLGIITNVIMSIFDESNGNVALGISTPELKAYSDSPAERAAMDKQTDRIQRDSLNGSVSTATYKDYDMIVMNNIAQLIDRGKTGTVTWTRLIEALPGQYRAGLTQLQLQRKILAGEDTSISVNGSVTINTLDESQLIIDWDEDTIPTNTTLSSPAGRNNTGSIDFIINPRTYNPTTAKAAGLRLLLLGAINTSANVGGLMDFGQDPSDGSSKDPYDGPDAWKNADGSDFVAGENDIVEWDGTKWTVVFDASTDSGTETKYITNLNTGVQYRWTGTEWILSFEGEYRKGTWRLSL
jgi:hypothetical protein|tara:strand:- start:337 stop:1842 length:1506 start_codon:yes stop_codon:yes gene_type:complete